MLIKKFQYHPHHTDEVQPQSIIIHLPATLLYESGIEIEVYTLWAIYISHLLTAIGNDIIVVVLLPLRTISVSEEKPKRNI